MGGVFFAENFGENFEENFFSPIFSFGSSYCFTIAALSFPKYFPIRYFRSFCPIEKLFHFRSVLRELFVLSGDFGFEKFCLYRAVRFISFDNSVLTNCAAISRLSLQWNLVGAFTRMAFKSFL